MKPSNFLSHPYDSVLKNNESEVVARNIMVVLSRTGDEFRNLTWDEYKQQRLQDGQFTESEKQYFDRVAGFCVSEQKAKEFCLYWAKKRVMFVKQNEATIPNGTAGCRVALVERYYMKDGIEMASVLVRDYDNFPCGPYQIPLDDIEIREVEA